MKLINKMTLLIITLSMPSLLLAHEGLHAAGQLNVGEQHMGLLEVSLAVLSLVAIGAWALHDAKSKK